MAAPVCSTTIRKRSVEVALTIQAICENAVAPTFRLSGGVQRKNSFRLSAVVGLLVGEQDFWSAAPALPALQAALNAAEFRYVAKTLVRQSLFIQLVNPEVTTTWYEVRWSQRLIGDPRFASAAQCMAVLERGAQLVLESLAVETGRRVIAGLASADIIRDGVPIDYVDPNAASIHRAENVCWLDSALSFNLLKQRSFLTDPILNPEQPIYRRAYEKIGVKTYLTDRAQTGEHKTNRELRWEAHPRSVQFALRKDCMEIEWELVDQLCRLEGVPTVLRDKLIELGIVDAAKPTVLCPVTLDPLRWDDFASEMSFAEMGKSGFQVGHLNPLKGERGDDPIWGHTAANVSWISRDGNRIQGHLSLGAVRELIERISRNYEAAHRQHSLGG